MSAIDKFREMFNKITAKMGDPWKEKVPVITGKTDGTVLTGISGYIWVRDLSSGQEIPVLNTVVAAEPNIFVFIGRRKDQPDLWQVIGRRETWSDAATSSVVHHHEQHEFMQPDMVMLDRRQTVQLSAIVADAEAFTVQFYGAVVPTVNGLVKIDDEVLDFSSYVPDGGALYVAIESDSDGALSLHAGDNFESLFLASEAYYPQPDPGKCSHYVVLLYEGLTSLSDDLIKPIMPLGTVEKSAGLQINEADADTPENDDEFGFWDVIDGALKKITWANLVLALTSILDTLYADILHNHFNDAEGDPADVSSGAALDGASAYAARRDHVHHAESSGTGHMHGVARWVSAGGTTFDLPDYAEYLLSASDNGVDVDPLTISLSSDRSQIVFDSAITATHIVVAEYVLAGV